MQLSPPHEFSAGTPGHEPKSRARPSRGRAVRLRIGRSERVRFILAGAFNTGFGYATFAAIILTFPRLHYMVALVVAHVIGVLVAYIVYRGPVFGVTGHFLRDLLKFWSLYLAGLATSLLLLPVLVGVLGIPVLVAPWLVVCVTAVLSYIGNKHFVFRRGSSPGDRSQPPAVGA